MDGYDDHRDDESPAPSEVAQLQLQMRAEQLLLVGQLARAQELAARAIAQDPEDAEGHLLLARVHLAGGDHTAALAAADQARNLDPAWPATHLIRAVVLSAAGRYAESELAVREAIELDPDEPVGHLTYARLLAMCERNKAALGRVEHALSLDPDDADAHALRAKLLMLVAPRDWQVSEQSARRALRLDPEDADAHAVLGHIYQQRNRIDEAEGCFRSALELDPNNQLALHGLAQAVMSRAFWYRPFLHYQLFMQRSSMGLRVALVVGLWVLVNLANQALASTGHAAVTPYLTYSYLGFCAYSWFADPVTRWILRRSYPWLPAADV